MPLSDEQRMAMMAETKEAAGALLEDVEHIKSILANKKTSRGDVRRLSATLRRLLVERDLTTIAAPRMGRFHFLAPDNKLHYRLEKERTHHFFASGGAPLFGPKLRPISVRDATPESMRREVELKQKEFIDDPTALLRLDGFLSQEVLCLHGRWTNRREAIKYVANVASGVHTDQPDTKHEKLLAHIRNAVSAVSDGENVTVTIKGEIFDNKVSDKFTYSPESIDMVLYEVMSAAYYVVNSPDLETLQDIIRKELAEG